MAVVVDATSHIGHASTALAGAAVAVPVAVYVMSVWLLHVRPQHPSRAADLAYPAAGALVLVSILTPWPLPLIAAVVAGLVATCVVVDARS
jgi:hypothetical protein